MKNAHRHLGQMAGPDDIYLALRGLRTLAARLPVHHRNGLALARYLATQPEVEHVYHPALEGDPGYAMWKRDFLGASGLFSFRLKPWVTREALAAMLEALKLFGMGGSWGGYESLVSPFRLKTYRNVAEGSGSLGGPRPRRSGKRRGPDRGPRSRIREAGASMK